MGLVAVISREPRLSMTEWMDCIDHNKALVRLKPRSIVNPFTGNPQIHTPDRSEVEIVVNDGIVGAIEPSPEFDDDGELHVYAPETSHEQLKEIASSVAGYLKAKLEWL